MERDMGHLQFFGSPPVECFSTERSGTGATVSFEVTPARIPFDQLLDAMLPRIAWPCYGCILLNCFTTTVLQRRRSSAPGGYMSRPHRPNIVIFMTDQERYPQYFPPG